MSDALDVLEAPASSVMYRGEKVLVAPITVGQVPKIVRAARPVLARLVALQEAPEGSGLDDAFIDELAALVGDHGEAVIEALAIAVDRKPEWIGGGGLDELVELATAVYEVNRDFFVRRLAPLLAARATAATGGAGPTPSSS